MPRTALILVGHGSSGCEDSVYIRFRDEIRCDYPDTWLAMLHGEPSVHLLIPRLRSEGITSALLFPLFVSPASHVTKDIAAEGAPFRRAFSDAGIQTDLLGLGLLEEKKLRDVLKGICLWRLQAAMSGSDPKDSRVMGRTGGLEILLS